MKQKSFSEEAVSLASRVFLEPESGVSDRDISHVGVSGDVQSPVSRPWYKRVRKGWYMAGGAILGSVITALFNR